VLAGKREMKPTEIILDENTVRVQLVRDGRPKSKLKITHPKHVYALFKDRFSKLDREEAWVVLLNGRNQVIGTNLLSIGILDASMIHPREVFKVAILGNAATIILVHQHPSGDVEPSDEDKAITKRIRNAGELLGIPLADHIIIGIDSFYSFTENL
jgi:DNA repair protein RadC